MDGFIAVLAIAVLVFAWWWLASKLQRNGRGWLLRNFVGSTVGSFAGLMVVILALAVGIIEAKPKSETKPAESLVEAHAPEPVITQAEVVSPAVPVSKDKPAKTLGLTPKQYATRLNALLKKLDLKHRIDGSRVVPGEFNNVLNAEIGKYTALVATISKDNGEVLDVVLMAGGDGTPESGLEIMMVGSAVLTAATDDVEFREVFQGLPSMIKGQERTYGAVKLSAKNMDQLGTWFLASPVEQAGSKRDKG